MSSLLTRRRTLIAVAADQAEGGGPNDGKYVYWRSRVSPFYVSGSSDFGQTFARKGNSYNFIGIASSSVAVDCYGAYYHVSNSRACKDDFTGSFSVYGLSTLKTGSGNSDYPMYPRGICVNRDASKVTLFTSNDFLDRSKINNVRLISFESQSRTGSVILTGSSVPGWTYNTMYGPFFAANADTLQYVIGGPTIHQKTGNAKNSGSISYDYGQTWTNIENVLFSSQSNDPNSMRGAVWTAKGDKCLVCYGSLGNSHLYLSKDYGQSFTQLSPPPGMEGNVLSVNASEKFKTVYVSGLSSSIATMFKSRNLGKTWTKIKSYGATGTVNFECNAAGDKLVALFYSGSESTRISYSLDYGDTWGQSNATVNYPGHAAGAYLIMSRDYRTGSEVEPEQPTGSYLYSMSAAQAQTTLAQLLQTAGSSNTSLTCSTDGTSLQTGLLRSYLDSASSEYDGYTYYQIDEYWISNQNRFTIEMGTSDNPEYDGTYWLSYVSSSWRGQEDVYYSAYNTNEIYEEAARILVNHMLSGSANGVIYVKGR